MRIDRTKFLKSSFLSAEKDMGLISMEILKNERLKRLLYYTDKYALAQAVPTPNGMVPRVDLCRMDEDPSASLFGKNIKLVPKIEVDQLERNYLLIRFRNFVPNPNNPEFRDNIIEFDILCPYEQWQLENFQLRPYRIAAEIDSTFDKKHLTGIGKLEFNGADQIILNDHFAGLCLTYRAIHGEEDKMVTPADDEAFRADFMRRFPEPERSEVGNNG